MGRPKRNDGKNAAQVATIKYQKNNYDRISVNVRKGERDKVNQAAAAHGETVNNFINRLLAENVTGFKPIETENSIVKQRSSQGQGD